jgi:hypothetical protein
MTTSAASTALSAIDTIITNHVHGITAHRISSNGHEALDAFHAIQASYAGADTAAADQMYRAIQWRATKLELAAHGLTDEEFDACDFTVSQTDIERHKVTKLAELLVSRRAKTA